MPAALWKMAEGSEAWAVKAPAKPIPRAPCSKRANPAAEALPGYRPPEVIAREREAKVLTVMEARMRDPNALTWDLVR